MMRNGAGLLNHLGQSVSAMKHMSARYMASQLDFESARSLNQGRQSVLPQKLTLPNASGLTNPTNAVKNSEHVQHHGSVQIVRDESDDSSFSDSQRSGQVKQSARSEK